MRRKLITSIAVVLILAGGTLGLGWPFGNGQGTLRLPGIVETQEVRLSSKVGGRVEKVVVAEGDVVEAGQPLVYFDLPELKAQRDQAQGKLQAAYAELDRARNGARKEEKAAAKATMEAAAARYEKLKAGPRLEEIEQARADLEAVEAELRRSEQELQRVTQLYTTRAVAQADYDVAVATQGRFRGQVNAARARLDLLLAGTRIEEIAEAAAEFAKAKANYDLLEAGTRPEDIAVAEARVHELEARLRELDVNLQEAVVKAPEKAVIEVVAVRKGDVTAAGAPVVRVLRAEDLWVKVFVPETELGKVRLHQKVTVTVDSYPNKLFEGEVVQVASISEFTPRNVQSVSERRFQLFAVKVRIADPQGVFKSGMAAEVVLPLH